jgi:adenylate cyclase class IV
MISWKRRLNTNSDVNEEEEVELTLKYEEYDNLLFIINKVLKMKQIESYERYRTIYFNEEIEISIDEYPFGIALEIENKSNNENPKDIVKKYLTILNLDINNSYKLFWDDKYTSLCKEQNIEIFKDVTFDKPMPEVTK